MGLFGRYRIAFGRYPWFQTQGPTSVRRFLCFCLLKEARPTDVDREKKFPIGTPMDHEGRRYRYWRAPTDIPRGQVVVGQALESTPEEKENKEGEETKSEQGRPSAGDD